ncbi:hypothetical protein ACHAW5_009684 [Stephanodiscus triporus]|uniref:Uncharacterized protein n=1 Tax=Stephanodiscus triporus TaxID=2934178 RepID=A0ABD3NAV0_9STRA
MRKRPVRPDASRRGKWGVASLGHPDSRGAVLGGQGEGLGSGDEGGAHHRSSMVGTGNSKLVRRKEFHPWNPEEGSLGEGAASSLPVPIATVIFPEVNICSFVPELAENHRCSHGHAAATVHAV